MGQMTVGAIFGVPQAALPRHVHLRFGDDDRDTDGLLDRWEEACAEAIAARQATLNRDPRYASSPAWKIPDARDAFVPDTADDAVPARLGFWVAVGSVGIPGTRRLTVDERLQPHKTLRRLRATAAYRNACRRWRRFARWAAAQGVALPPPRFVFAQVEVA